jgi:phage repressor protein C with HTH and peptisase S24 domain
VLLKDWVIKEQEKYNGSLNAVSKATGISHATLRGIRSGNLTLKEETVNLLSKYIGKPKDALIKQFGIQDVSSVMAKKSSNEKAVETFENITWIPVYDIMASAGNGIMNYPVLCQTGFNGDEIAAKFGNNHRLEGIKVRGDSMQPTVDDGDIVYINRDDTTPKNGIFVIRIGDEVLIKRLSKLPNKSIRVSSDNEVYPPFEIDLNGENLDFEIIGKVWKKMQDVD